MENTTKQYHYYGATCMNWAVGETRQEVLKKLGKAAGADMIRRQVKANGGMYAWTVKVLLPQDADYTISFFQPVNVPMEAAVEYIIMDAKGYVLPLD